MELFGTDGVRGEAGTFLDAKTALKIAQAAGIYFKKNAKTNKILVGKDTRRSGYMIENALVSGLTSVGFNVIQIGPMPTPAIAYLTNSMRCDAGIMLSASHNDFEDNGIKFFDGFGNKLNNDIEQSIEDIYFDDDLINKSQCTHKDIGSAKRIDDVIGRYIVSIKSSFPTNTALNDMKIVLDCANGAGYKVGPTILEELGANLKTINNTPDGFNINENCGALYPNELGKEVLAFGADIGIALDGDADRLVVVDEKGNTIDGDHLIGAIAIYMKNNDMLRCSKIASTVMSNDALDVFLQKHDIELLRSSVGDKNVLELMQKENINFGAENSGHIIFSDISKTGDGLASALQLLALLIKSGKKASEVLRPFDLYPSILNNIKIQNKIPLNEISGLDKILNEIEKRGLRQLIRYSGTENKIRLLLEGENEQTVKEEMGKLETFIKSALC
jgi:phosphoglucosamine mutase